MQPPITRFTLVITVLILAGCAVGTASGEEVRPPSDENAIGEVLHEEGPKVQSKGLATFGLG
ncbi:MAG: hypothetical protein ACYTFG_01670 [Planctomycetota bacterium]|jgi:hypothetical protein